MEMSEPTEDVQIKQEENVQITQEKVTVFLSRPELGDMESDIYECPVCAQLFTKAAELADHQKIHKNAVLHECSLCALIFNSEEDLSQHVLTHSDVTDMHVELRNNSEIETTFSSSETEVYNCIICGKNFRLKSEYIVHMKLHSDAKMFEENSEIADELDLNKLPQEVKQQTTNFRKVPSRIQKLVCVMCLDQFTNRVDLLKHQATHCEVEVYTCALCQKEFTQKDDLFTHGDVHNETEEYSCGVCMQVFTKKDDLIRHMDDHIGDKHKCTICGEEFLQLWDLTCHVATQHNHENEHIYKCKICRKEFDNNHDYNQHIKHHTHPFKCTVCPRKCDNQEQLDIHMKNHKGERNYKCDICNKEFMHMKNLSRHLKTHTEDRQHKCGECGRAFHNISDLNVHSRIHTGVKPYECTQCGKRFRTCSNLHTHLVIHSSERLFKCPLCEKDFKFNSDLKRHMPTHSNEKPYQCNICQKCFTQNCSLEVHMRSHSGVKPFNCPVCNKAFGHQCDLRRHMRTHDETKPYVCEVCKKAFNRLGNLQTHMRIHVGDKPYECTVCKKRFNQQGHLNAHMVTHSTEKPFRCLRCGAGFTRNSTLNKHMRIHSKMEQKDWESPPGPSVAIKQEIQLVIDQVQQATQHDIQQGQNVGQKEEQNMCKIKQEVISDQDHHLKTPCENQGIGILEHNQDETEGSGTVLGVQSKTKKLLGGRSVALKAATTSAKNKKDKFGTVAGSVNPFKCFVCDERFSTKEEVIAHVETHDEKPEESHDFANIVIKQEKVDP